MVENGKVRVIEGMESGEFGLKIGGREIYFVEITKTGESESYFCLDDWLLLGKRKSYFSQERFFGQNDSFVLKRFFEETSEKEVLP